MLQEVTMKHISNDVCDYFYTSSVTNAMLCAGDGRHDDPGGAKGPCQGDSGGPFFIERNGEPVVVGVVSFGSSCKFSMYILRISLLFPF